MAPALAVHGLEKRYGRVQALGGVDLEVREGELVGLLGPNGAGKSTLVKIACGLVHATRGRAEICGAPAGSPAARAALGYLAELFRFPGWHNAAEVLVLHQRLARSDGGAAERAELLELVGLADARRRRVEQMSKGMQQRLGLAQALVGQPKVLLLDEPTSALDPAGRRTVRGLLEELRRRGIGVLLNSHLLSEVELVCDRVVIISKGMVAAAGSPSELARPRGVEIDTNVAALSLLGSVVLTATANGIAVFMIFGAGLVAGLLGQIGEALNSDTLRSVARTTSWVLPFEALYQDALNRITIDTVGFTRFALNLGPFGGAQSGGDSLPAWTLAYIAAVGALALVLFARRDL